MNFLKKTFERIFNRTDFYYKTKTQSAISNINKAGMKKILLLNDCECADHWGCYGTNLALKKQLCNKDIIEIISVENWVVNKLNKIPRSVAEFGDKQYFAKIYPNLARDINSCDAVVINGEGTIHHFARKPRLLLYLAFSAKHFFHKPVFLLNHSCYPCSEEKQVLDFYMAGYQSCDYVAAREKQSASIIENTLGVKCVLSFDSLPLSIKEIEPFIKIAPLSLSSPYICISDAVNYNPDNSPIIAKAILTHCPPHHYQYIYLCGLKTRRNYQQDLAVFNSLKTYLPQLQLVEARTFIEWLAVIKCADLLISGRFHYTVAALSLGVKTISFASNTPKIDSIAKDFDIQEAIPIAPAAKLESMLNQQLEASKTQSPKNFLEDFCALALKNYEWDI